MKKIVILGIAVLLGLIMLCNSCSTIGTGTVGIVTKFGAVQPNVFDEGLHIKNPFTTKVVRMPVQTVEIQIECSAASKDLQTIKSVISVNYHVIKDKAQYLYQSVGKAYEDTIIKPAIQEVVKSATSKYTAEETIIKRSEVSTQIQEGLTMKLADYGIFIDVVNIINFDFSDEFNKAIEAKQTAQQQALKAEQDLVRIEVENRQRVSTANADAEAKKAAADAEAYSIQKTQEQLAKDPKYIQYVLATKWNGVLPVVSSDGANIIDVGTITGK